MNSATPSRELSQGGTGGTEPQPLGERVQQVGSGVGPELHRAERAAQLGQFPATAAQPEPSEVPIEFGGPLCPLNPKVTGRPGCPWVRPHIGVSRTPRRGRG